MFDTIVIAIDGSASVCRAVSIAVNLVERFDASVHTLYVVDVGDVGTAPNRLRDEMRDAFTECGEETLAEVEAAADREVTVAVREGRPVAEILNYTREVDADAVAMGTRGHHDENRFLIGSVAEHVVRICPVPMLTVRRLEEGTTDSLPSDEAAWAGRVARFGYGS